MIKWIRLQYNWWQLRRIQKRVARKFRGVTVIITTPPTKDKPAKVKTLKLP